MTIRNFGIDNPLPAEDFKNDKGNRSIRFTGGKVTYRGFTIVEKRDFGQRTTFIDRTFIVKHGYVVTDGMCNVMPGGCWFMTVDDALKACDDLIASEDMEPGAKGEHPFWTLHRFRQEAEENAPELALLLQRVMDNKEAFFELEDGLQEQVVATLNRIDRNCDTRDRTINVDKTVTMHGPQPPRFNLRSKFNVATA